MRSVFRIMLASLALSLAATTVAAPAHGAAGFGDVEADRWYTAPIAWMVTEGITNGTEPGCFSPHSPVSRGQIIAFLYRLDSAQGNAPATGEHPFADVVRPYQHEPVGWAYRAGVTTGTSDTTFAPDANVTRGDFGVLLWRYAGEPRPETAHPFTDVVRGYQQDAVSWMAENGITTGTSPTTFSPDGTMTRAEAATFLFRFMAPDDVFTVQSTTTGDHCLQWYIDLLVGLGMTNDEATCAAPFLVDLGRGYLVGVLDDSESVDGPFFSAIADIIAAGCVAPSRYATLVSVLW
ncbi:MAG: S-layer homology domain-containing protein [Actinomycetota bacterium]